MGSYFSTKRMNLPNETKDLYSESYQTLMKEIKDTNRKIYHSLGLEDST